MDEEYDVKPCPFCGEDIGFAGMTPDAFAKTTTEFALACHCGATGPLRPTMQEALEAWNQRAAYRQAKGE